MKKVLFAISIITSFTANSQMKNLYEETTFSNRWILKDALASILPSDFNYFGLDSIPSQNMYAFHFMDTSGNEVTIQFIKGCLGCNKDLNIKGEEVLRDVKLHGPYRFLFPFWKKHFNDKADMQAIQKNREAKIILKLSENDSIIQRFQVYAQEWVLYVQ